MERLLICNLSMKKDLDRVAYEGMDDSIITDSEEYYLPINARLVTMLKPEDKLRVVGIAKKDSKEQYKKNIEEFRKEFDYVAERTGASITFDYIESEYNEIPEVHNKLLKDLIHQLRQDERIMIDVTFGPRSLLVILFAVLPFADRFFNCDVDTIMYGEVEFDENNKPCNGVLCEWASLYHLNSINNRIKCNTLEEAMAVLELLI